MSGCQHAPDAILPCQVCADLWMLAEAAHRVVDAAIESGVANQATLELAYLLRQLARTHVTLPCTMDAPCFT